MTRWFRRLANVFRRNQLERDLDAELRMHLRLDTERFLQAGHSRAEARRLAHVRLGGVEQVKERWRRRHPLVRLGAYWLDVKLGGRRLRKSWGLTLVGGLAMVTVFAGATTIYAFIDVAFRGVLPLDEGERVVALQTWDDTAHRRRNTAMADLGRWRRRLASVVDIGGFQTVEHNLFGTGGHVEPVSVAEMTASGFRLARVAPLLGRPIVEADQSDHVGPVVVLGYDEWRTRFDGDPGVLGQTIRLGVTEHTIVGVMPRGFAFPVNHTLWTPLRLSPEEELQTAGPQGVVFGRLAPGVSMEQAQVELSTLGLLPTGSPDADAHRQPRLVPYTFAFTGDFDRGEVGWLMTLMLAAALLLLVPPCANLAILIYARTVIRHEEFSVRSALGASRGRIVGQLFVEMLVLATGAVLVALVVVRLLLEWLEVTMLRELGGGAPFWMHFELSFSTVVFAAALALIASTIVGILPGLKATGRRMQAGRRAMSSRTTGQLGTTWTMLVVAQVGLALAALPTAAEIAWGTVRDGVTGPGFPADEFFTARIAMDPRAAVLGNGDRLPVPVGFAGVPDQLVARLGADSSVTAVTMASAVPNEAPWMIVEVEGGSSDQPALLRSVILARSLEVDEEFFDATGQRLLAGRLLVAGDTGSARRPVVVTRTFAQQVFGHGNPVGQRVRYRRRANEPVPPDADRAPWHEVVGVVDDLFATSTHPTVHHLVDRGHLHPVTVLLHTRPDSTALADRLRQTVGAIGPTLRVDQVRTLGEIFRQQQQGNYLGASALGMATLTVLLLSAAGMYALMSFTVNQRRREIGIRTALGAPRLRLVVDVFSRALRQLAVGAGLGALGAAFFARLKPAELLDGQPVPFVLPAATVLIVLIGVMAAIGPARRSLAIDPAETLRDG